MDIIWPEKKVNSWFTLKNEWEKKIGEMETLMKSKIDKIICAEKLNLLSIWPWFRVNFGRILLLYDERETNKLDIYKWQSCVDFIDNKMRKSIDYISS